MNQHEIWVPIHDDRRCALDLLPSGNPPGILVRFNAEVVSAARCFNSEIVNQIVKDGGFSGFSSLSDGNGRFGFDDSIEVREGEGGWLNLIAPFPVFEFLSDEDCRMCGGSKERDGEECFSCCGRGKELIYEHGPLNAVVLSLSIVFEGLHTLGSLSGPNGVHRQLIVPQVHYRPNACFVGGSLTPVMSEWIFRQSNQELPVEVGAMKQAWRAMNPVSNLRPEDRRFRAWVRQNAWLCVECPGQACGLNPEHSFSYRPGRGQEVCCHNVDGSHQVLTLLAFLAALCGRARREGVGISR